METLEQKWERLEGPKVWYRFQKISGGHVVAETYEHFRKDNTDDEVKMCCREWAAEVDDEHDSFNNVSYNYHKVDCVPESFIQDQIEQEYRLINIHHRNIDFWQSVKKQQK